MPTDLRSTILVALRPGVRQKFEDAIGEAEHDIVFCHTFEHAKGLLATQPIDAVVATLQFDESRMFELLRTVRAHQDHKTKPFVAVRLTCGGLPDEVIRTVMRSAIICGADAAVDYSSIETCSGVSAANLALRAALARCSA